MRGKYVGAKQIRRLVWAWVEFVERDAMPLDDLYLAVRDIGEGYWPDERDLERMRGLWSDEDD